MVGGKLVNSHQNRSVVHWRVYLTKLFEVASPEKYQIGDQINTHAHVNLKILIVNAENVKLSCLFR